MKLLKLFLLSSALTLYPSLANATPKADIKAVYDLYEAFYPSFPKFYICSGHGCKYVNEVTLSSEMKSQLSLLFKDIDSAENERIAIANAISYLETVIGNLTGTHIDKKSLGVLSGGSHGNMDCVDEALNSTTYLLLLEELKLLKYHESKKPDWKGGIFKWTHYAATFIDKETNVLWALDSGVEDNGGLPLIITWEKFYE